MQSSLPAWLKQAIDAELHGVSGRALAAEYARMSDAYRQGQASKAQGDPALYWLSYLAGRLPATYAAVESALSRIPPELIASCESVLDLGSGPGTAIWAAAAAGVRNATAIERDASAIILAEKLSQAAPLKPQFIKGELPGALANAPEADLVIIAYAAIEAGTGMLEAALAKARKLLVIVEPGTPAGFKIMLQARQALKGLVAPCPQAGDCPLAVAPEAKWCHFSARLERSRMAKLLKGGDLGYEDEKFCYAVFSKSAAALAPARIIGFPKRAEGHIALELCTREGIKTLALAKHQKQLYKAAKKAAWGDAWN